MLHVLPPELVLRVALWLRPRDVQRLRRVCRRLRLVCSDDVLWSNMLRLEYPSSHGKNAPDPAEQRPLQVFRRRCTQDRRFDSFAACQSRLLLPKSSDASLAVALDATHIIAAGDSKCVSMWRRDSGQRVAQVYAHDDWIVSLDMTPTMVASGSRDRTVCVYCRCDSSDDSSGDGRSNGNVDGRGTISAAESAQWHEPRARWASSVAASDVTGCVAVGDSFGVVWTFDPSVMTTTACCRGHTDPVMGVLQRPDLSLLISCGWDGSIRSWDLRAAQPLQHVVREAHRAAVSAMAMQGFTMLTGGLDRVVRLWDWRQMRRAIAADQHHTGFVRTVALDADQRRGVSAGADRSLAVFRCGDESLRHVASLRRMHAHTITSVAMDECAVATASRDGSVRYMCFDSGSSGSVGDDVGDDVDAHVDSESVVVLF